MLSLLLSKGFAATLPSDSDSLNNSLESTSASKTVDDSTKNENLPTAVVWYLELAEKGDAEAQYNLGSIYETGFGVPIDLEKAAQWYEKAAEQDYAKAQIKLGIMHYLGMGVRQSPIRGNRLIRSASGKGDALAEMLYKKVVAPEVVREMTTEELLQKILPFIDQGEKQASAKITALINEDEKKRKEKQSKARFTGPAKNTLGEEIKVENNVPGFLEKNGGNSVSASGSDNLALIQRDANAGLPDAQFALGRIYELGTKLEKNTSEAVKWYSLAAQKGHADSQYRLGIMYLYGVGVNRDNATGKQWLGKAASQNHEVAVRLLPIIQSNPINGTSIALVWYLEKAVDGDPDGQFGLGFMYENGWGLITNSVESRRWYASARETGSGDAAVRLRQIKADKASLAPDTPEKFRPKIEPGTLPTGKKPLIISGTIDPPKPTSTDRVADVMQFDNRGLQKQNEPLSFTDRIRASASRSALTPVVLIIFGIIMGVMVFKWMRRSTYKNSMYPR